MTKQKLTEQQEHLRELGASLAEAHILGTNEEEMDIDHEAIHNVFLLDALKEKADEINAEGNQSFNKTTKRQLRRVVLDHIYDTLADLIEEGVEVREDGGIEHPIDEVVLAQFISFDPETNEIKQGTWEADIDATDLYSGYMRWLRSWWSANYPVASKKATPPRTRTVSRPSASSQERVQRPGKKKKAPQRPPVEEVADSIAQEIQEEAVSDSDYRARVKTLCDLAANDGVPDSQIQTLAGMLLRRNPYLGRRGKALTGSFLSNGGFLGNGREDIKDQLDAISDELEELGFAASAEALRRYPEPKEKRFFIRELKKSYDKGYLDDTAEAEGISSEKLGRMIQDKLNKWFLLRSSL
jgi:hypothetical protein